MSVCRLIGPHAPSSNHMLGAIDYTLKLKSNICQLFVSPPSVWNIKNMDQVHIDKFIEYKKEHNIIVYAHAAYLINLLSNSDIVFQKSIKALRDTFIYATKLNIKGIILHTGSTVEAVEFDWIKDRLSNQVYSHLENIFEECSKYGNVPLLLLEPTAGQGKSVCNRPEDIDWYFSFLQNHINIKLCLDTCHLFAAGYNLNVESVDNLLSEINASIGLKSLGMFHINNSKYALGLKKDRHMGLSKGMIDINFFNELSNNKWIYEYNIPFIVETPKQYHEEDISLLYKMLLRN